MPSTTSEWLTVAAGFQQRWNMPHVVGSIDGKHIRIRCPRNSGSLYYNYKSYYSVVLMAIVDYDYKFLFADVGAEGRASDSRIWRESDLYHDMEDPRNPLNMPPASHIPGIEQDIDYYLVGDDAFPLSRHLMKPYPATRLPYIQRIFNYRLSRCRRIAENGFGILANRFHILLRQQDMEPQGAKMVVMACVALHNFLRVKCGNVYIPAGSVDWEDNNFNPVAGTWREEEFGLDSIGGRQHVGNRSQHVKQMRNDLANWCVSRNGSVHWQYNLIPRYHNEQ